MPRPTLLFVSALTLLACNGSAAAPPPGDAGGVPTGDATAPVLDAADGSDAPTPAPDAADSGDAMPPGADAMQPGADATSPDAGSLWSDVPAGTTKLAFADLTGDSLADLIALTADGTVTVRPSNGTHFLAWDSGAWPSPPFPTSLSAPLIDFADATGDAKADAIVVSSGGMFVFPSTGAGFGPSTLWTTSSGGTHVPSTADATQFADVDGDGKVDAIEINPDGVRVDLSTGSAFVSTPNSWTNDTVWWGDYNTAFADVTGDGKADCLGVNTIAVYALPSDGTKFDVYASDGSQNYYPWTRLADGTPASFHGNQGTPFADLDGDGRADVIAVDLVRLGDASTETTFVRALLSNGSAFPSPASDGGPDPTLWFVSDSTLSRVYFADVSGDKRADLIGVDAAGLSVRVWLSDGSGFVGGP